jgi:predicted transcriptional regulator
VEVQGRKRAVAKARRLFCQMAVKEVGYSGAKVGRFLGVTTSAVNRWATSEELPDLAKHI